MVNIKLVVAIDYINEKLNQVLHTHTHTHTRTHTQLNYKEILYISLKDKKSEITFFA